MTLVGKNLIEQAYGKAPQYSYFLGCSTGGRQALMEVQRYPDDYNGVIAGAPGINMPKLHAAQLWGQVVMKEANNYLPLCKLDAVEKAAVASCDRLDGLADGIIEEPRACNFSPQLLIGKSVPSCGVFTDADASVVKSIMDGPRRSDGSRLWYGLAPGAGRGSA